MKEFDNLYSACMNVNADNRATVESFEDERNDLLENLKTKLKKHGDIGNFREIDDKLVKLVNMADEQAETFDRAGWETSNLCSKAMAHAYRNVIDILNNSSC
jgi:hypothetical protein